MTNFLINNLNELEQKIKIEYLKAALNFLQNQNFTFTYEKEIQEEIFKVFFSCNDTVVSIYFCKKDSCFEVSYFVDKFENDDIDENDETSKMLIWNQFSRTKSNWDSLLFFSFQITNKNDNPWYQQCCSIYEKLINQFLLNKNESNIIVWTRLDKYYGDHFYSICFDISATLNKYLKAILSQYKYDFNIHLDNSYSFNISDDLLLRIVFDNDIHQRPITCDETWLILEFQGIWIYLGTVDTDNINILQTWIN